jgi:hypothetical protein
MNRFTIADLTNLEPADTDAADRTVCPIAVAA